MTRLNCVYLFIYFFNCVYRHMHRYKGMYRWPFSIETLGNLTMNSPQTCAYMCVQTLIVCAYLWGIHAFVTCVFEI